MEFNATFEPFFLACFLYLMVFCAVSLFCYVPQHKRQTDLDKFCERVSQDPFLEERLEAIIKQENFLDRIVELGVALGYSFNVAEVEDAIALYTPPQQCQYVCLPIGCWQKV